MMSGVRRKKEKVREELADVLNYCILMADTCGLDLDEIIQEKVKRMLKVSGRKCIRT